MKVKLISATVITRVVKIAGKSDKRFKSGWRHKPDLYVGYELKLSLTNPMGRFRLREIIITPFGKYMVTSFLGGFPVRASEPDTYQMQLTQLDQLETMRRYVEPLVFDAEIDIMSGGLMYLGEGSTPITNIKTQ